MARLKSFIVTIPCQYRVYMDPVNHKESLKDAGTYLSEMATDDRSISGGDASVETVGGLSPAAARRAITATLLSQKRPVPPEMVVVAIPELLKAAKKGLAEAEGFIKDRYEGTSSFKPFMKSLDPIRKAIAKWEPFGA